MIPFFTKPLFLKFIKFGIVGFSGVFIDFGFTYLTKEYLKAQKYLANAIGFTMAASSNYYLNRIWTFHSHDPNVGEEYMRFILVSLLGLGISTLVIYVLNGRFKMNFYFAKLFAIGGVTIWNFFVNIMYTFVS
jgi:putative flippase GtrA